MRAFTFVTAGEILFGNGRLSELPEVVSHFGRRPLLLFGGGSLKKLGIVDRALDLLRAEGLDPVAYGGVSGEPDVETVDAVVKWAREEGVNAVVGLGGGSVLDVGKAVSGLLTNDGSVLEYLEGVGAGRKLEQKPLPYVAVPTTAGTGSEVTKNAVVFSKTHNLKRSLRDRHLFPMVALVDPELTLSLPPEITARTGLDAFTQLVESFLSNRANALTDALAIEGVRRVARALPWAVSEGSNLKARQDMSLAATFSGVALANAGLGAVHGIAAALGGRCGVPHGLACAVLLPHVMEANRPHCEDKMALLAGVMLGRIYVNPREGAKRFLSEVRDLTKTVGLPERLAGVQVSKEEMAALVQDSQGSSMRANPVELSDNAIASLIQKVVDIV